MSEPRVERFAGAAGELRGLLGRAFCDNPGMVATLGEERPRRLARATRLMGGLSGMALASGTVEVVRAGGKVAATSLSYGPDQKPRGRALLPMYLAGLSTGPRALVRLLRLDEFLRTHHPHAPHFFLAVLGVEPDFRTPARLGAAARCRPAPTRRSCRATSRPTASRPSAFTCATATRSSASTTWPTSAGCGSGGWSGRRVGDRRRSPQSLAGRVIAGAAMKPATRR
ncbi:hypothetical protein [Nannocystis pusilla]|uniref:hypothetical protein n=1 Tax=Nannocystis pusilla TaxID=889268 RepID=UPI003B7EC74D